MNADWKEAPVPPLAIGPGGWLRVLVKGGLMSLVCYGGLVLLLLLRLVEWPLHGANRPWTPHITQSVCRLALAILGLRREVRGQPMHEKGAVVANHSSWLDIFTLNASQRIYFVAKSEVSGWPGIGWLARATGTVFITRKGTEAKRQQDLFEARLRAGHQLLFFPEGTSTDALRVLPFKPTLFQAFFTHGLDRVLFIQPVTVAYHAPRRGPALLRLVGRHGLCEPPAAHPCRPAAGPGRGDLPPARAGGCLPGKEGTVGPLRTRDPRRASARGLTSADLIARLPPQGFFLCPRRHRGVARVA